MLSNAETVVEDLFDKSLRINPMEWKDLPCNLIRVLMHAGSYKVASGFVEKGVTLARSNAVKKGRMQRHWKLALHSLLHSSMGLYCNLACEAREVGDYANEIKYNQVSVEVARESYELMKELHGDEHLDALGHKRCLGCRLLAVGRIDQAAEMIRSAQEKRLPSLRRQLHRRGINLDQLSLHDQRKLRHGDKRQVSMLGYDHYLLGLVALERQEFPEAERQFRKALRCAEVVSLGGQNDFDVASASVRLAESLRHQQRQTNEISDLEERARTILRGNYLRFNCGIDLPKVRKELAAPRPLELDSLSTQAG